MIVPHGFVYDLPNGELFRDEWVVLMDAEHPSAATGLTADELETLPWVLVYHGSAASTPAARQLRMLGIEPRVQVVTESFLTVPSLLMGSNRIALVPSRMLGDHPHPRLVSHRSPIPLEPLAQAMWWHPIHDHEPEHQFLREVVSDAVGRICGSG